MKINRDSIIQRNAEYFKEKIPAGSWLTEKQKGRAERERESILKSMEGEIKVICKGTKLYHGSISKGCRICAAGKWSCLFINGKCNAACFFCPSAQKSMDAPITNGIEFSKVKDYTDYLKRFDFKGAAISGGEPFLSFERSMSFIRKIRRSMGEEFYIWLYTNGMEATREKIKRLSDAGLDEMRFNICAVNYNLDKVKAAVGNVGTVTVEIPAIPEDYEVLKKTILELEAIGANRLNVHQLRCTQYNSSKLVKRGYTFLHGPAVTVLESELTALRLLEYAAAEGTGLGVHYCSNVYRRQYQGMAARKLCASYISEDYEDITETGFIRHFKIKGQADELKGLMEKWSGAGIAGDNVKLDETAGVLIFNEEAFRYAGDAGKPIYVSYYMPVIRSFVSYRHRFKKLALNARRELIVEKVPAVTDVEAEAGSDITADLLRNMAAEDRKMHRPLVEDRPYKIVLRGFEDNRFLYRTNEMEYITEGLQEYF